VIRFAPPKWRPVYGVAVEFAHVQSFSRDQGGEVIQKERAGVIQLLPRFLLMAQRHHSSAVHLSTSSEREVGHQREPPGISL
jgi:hypothetical protein